MCMDMYIDTCIDMCMDMCIHVVAAMDHNCDLVPQTCVYVCYKYVDQHMVRSCAGGANGS